MDLLESPDREVTVVVSPFASSIGWVLSLLASAAHNVTTVSSLSARSILKINVEVSKVVHSKSLSLNSIGLIVSNLLIEIVNEVIILKECGLVEEHSLDKVLNIELLVVSVITERYLYLTHDLGVEEFVS
jgi:hypothetical protein